MSTGSRVTSSKLIPLLEGYTRTNTPQQNRELAHSLIVLGPQVHGGKKYQALSNLGEPVKSVPLDNNGNFNHQAVTIHVTDA